MVVNLLKTSEAQIFADERADTQECILVVFLMLLSMVNLSDALPEPSETSKLDLFTKIVEKLHLLYKKLYLRCLTEF